MIISCIKCDKKFEVNSDLIPTQGRSIQCGSCNHLWFFVKDKAPIEEDKSILNQNNRKNTKKISKSIISKSKKKANKKEIVVFKDHKKKSFMFSKLLSILIVFIISSVAILLILDTFKVLLYNYFPNLEILLFSLFEILIDIKLFIKDLI